MCPEPVVLVNDPYELLQLLQVANNKSFTLPVENILDGDPALSSGSHKIQSACVALENWNHVLPSLLPCKIGFRQMKMAAMSECEE